MKTPRNPPTYLHPGHTTPDGPEGTEALGEKTLLHAPRGAQSGSTHIPHLARLNKRKGGQGLTVGSILLENRLLERTGSADGCSTHTPSVYVSSKNLSIWDSATPLSLGWEEHG